MIYDSSMERGDTYWYRTVYSWCIFLWKKINYLKVCLLRDSDDRSSAFFCNSRDFEDFISDRRMRMHDHTRPTHPPTHPRQRQIHRQIHRHLKS